MRCKEAGLNHDGHENHEGHENPFGFVSLASFVFFVVAFLTYRCGEACLKTCRQCHPHHALGRRGDCAFREVPARGDRAQRLGGERTRRLAIQRLGRSDEGVDSGALPVARHVQNGCG